MKTSPKKVYLAIILQGFFLVKISVFVLLKKGTLCRCADDKGRYS
jgi:hypothetical protein